jgi:transcriptional regulator with XRE-family HTH domain
MEINMNNTYISDYAVLIKKMRLHRRLNRQQASLFFDFTFKNIEKLENGRGNISVELFKEFQAQYNFTDTQVEQMRLGEIKASDDANSIRRTFNVDKRKDRRFNHKKITKECKVLKELRLKSKLTQYEASKLCGLGINSIGFIENGRVTLTENKIRQILITYGENMELFNQLLRRDLLKHEVVDLCHGIINEMDENQLRVVMPMLQSLK